MARKNANARGRSRRNRVNLAPNTHLMYSTDEFGEDATVVRYMGESSGDYLTVFHPEGYVIEAHMHHLWLPRKTAA